MGKFKVGDIVKHRTACDMFRNGQPAKVVEVENGSWDIVAEIIDGPHAGTRGYGLYENWDLIEASTDTDELAELRAFRDAAIAKYPDLAPVDPDLIEARRIASHEGWTFDMDRKYGELNSRELESGDYDNHYMIASILMGIKWARANPR